MTPARLRLLDVPGDLPHTLKASQTAPALPLFSQMAEEDRERVMREAEALLG